jgi:hypothetical protein
MKKFIVNLFSNRFGIVLATLNVCYFAGIEFSPFGPPGTYFLYINLPAAILTSLSVLTVRIFSSKLSVANEMILGNTLFTFLIIMQWLFIAWIAKIIAQKLRPKEL